MALDYAQQIELSLLEQQKPMNDVIDRGDSDVQQFYRDTTVLVTGSTGFLGKQLVEKLFRSCDIKKVYLLIRPKKGKPIEERLTSILKDPLYDIVRKKKPYFVERIVPVEGDVGELRLGLSQKDWDTITKEVNVIIHMAATVNFDEPLHVAGLINVRGTREMLELGKQCQHLKLFTHVSTAFAHATVKRINTDVKEQFYPTAVNPYVFLEMVACMDRDRINRIQPALIEDWPNTYTFTKALAEELVRISAGDLPVCIVKPPVVTNAFLEPSPGWIDQAAAMSSCMGVLLGAGLGVIHVLLVEKDVVVSYAPVDIVNNAIIAAGWDSVQHRQLWAGDIPIYTISNSNGSIKWGMFGQIMHTDEFYRLSSPKALWYSYLLETNNLLLFRLLSLFLHFIPGYILDALITVLGVRPKGIPSLVKVYNRVHNLTMLYNYFLTNTWNFRDDNLQAMIARLSPADSAIYNCDVTRIDVKEFCQACCIGTRRFIYKDGLQGSDVGYRKQQWLYYANIVFMSLYMYCIWRLLTMFYATLVMLLPL